MSAVSKQTESRLMTVIEKTAELVSGGATPNDAIVKLAREYQLTPSHIDLVVKAFNTGRTTKQRQDNYDVLEKAADFELADTSTILDNIFPEHVKSAAEIYQSTCVDSSYELPPTRMLEKVAKMQKLATPVDYRVINGQAVEAPQPYPQDPRHAETKKYADVQRARRAAEEARRQFGNAEDNLFGCMNKLAGYFKTAGSYKFADVRETAAIMLGPAAVCVLDNVNRMFPGVEKTASATRIPDVVDMQARPFAVLHEALALVDELSVKEASVHEKEQELAVKEAANFPFPEQGQKLEISTSDIFSDEPLTEKEASILPDPLKALGAYSLVKNTLSDTADRLSGPDTNARVQKMIQQLDDPAHEAKLRELNTQTMLHDLMLNDDIISGYDPNEVTDAYNDIVQISPSVGDQRMLVQALLRKRLQQGMLDTFDQSQLLDYEKKLREQLAPLSGRNDGYIL